MLKRPLRAARGFSLIELLIGLAIVGLLLRIAMPTFRTWVQNTQIRAAAHEITNGMSIARTEAVRRNVQVQMRLTTAANGQQGAWTVSEVASGAQVQKWSAAEGASSTQIVQSGGGIVTFNSLGRVVSPNPADNSAPLLQVDVTSANNASDTALRPMRVQVGNGGNPRMCDPALAKPDPMAC